MDKDELKRMANNPDFIPGIYNYCDRWCERCPHTSECFLFATEKKQATDAGHADIENEEFWDNMENIFAFTFELLEEAAHELDIDLDHIEAKEQQQREEAVRTEAQKHAAAQEAKRYITEVDQWFDDADAVFKKKGNELKQLAELRLPEAKILEEAETLQDYVEIIRWYQHQIYAKIMRALQGRMDDLKPADPVQNDYNGSAKVALIGVKRSIAAWGGLLKKFPEREDAILELLVSLAKIRRQLKATFPCALQFKRPGFDD